jgi:hypothetical protein
VGRRGDERVGCGMVWCGTGARAEVGYLGCGWWWCCLPGGGGVGERRGRGVDMRLRVVSREVVVVEVDGGGSGVGVLQLIV